MPDQDTSPGRQSKPKLDLDMLPWEDKPFGAPPMRVDNQSDWYRWLEAVDDGVIFQATPDTPAVAANNRRRLDVWIDKRKRRWRDFNAAHGIQDRRLAGYVRNTFSGAVDDVAREPKGGRNHLLNAKAYKLGAYVNENLLDRGDVTDALLDAARVNGVLAGDGEKKCRKSIESGLNSAAAQGIVPKLPEYLWDDNAGKTGKTSMAQSDGQESEIAEPAWTFTNGASFILDIPDTIPPLWGRDNQVLWAEDESLMIAGPMGLGKTTLLGLLIRAQLGVGDGKVLGMSVTPRPGKILYLAMDRPAQIARALHRQFTEAEREVLAERLLIWKGPPPADIAKNPGLLLALAEAAGAQTVYLDSIKDAAIGLSEDEVGAAYNRARQTLLAEGRELGEAHHTVKRGANAGPPTTVADIYGSAWITNGTGSIILLAGEPGDPIVGFRHVRAPAEEVGPWRLLHDQTKGTMTIDHAIDLPELVRLTGPDGLSAKAAAKALTEKDNPSRAAIEKARRKLDKLTMDGTLVRVDGGSGRGATTAWFLAERRSA